jgi:acyl-CoA synthetase (AMP-forming)/AMP-acid ligase II
MTQRNMTLLWHYVEHFAAKNPEKEALVYEEQRISWAQFRDKVDRTAKALLELGVEKGDCVALAAMGCPEFMYTFMAASKIGAIWVGLSPKFTVEELRTIMSDCRPKVLVTLREYMGIDLLERGLTLGYELPSLLQVLVIGEACNGTINFDEFTDRPRPHLDEPLEARANEGRPDDETLLMYTSGSTGRPKGVLHTHASVLANVAIEAAACNFSEDSRVIVHMPINHVAADVEIAATALYAGGAMVLTDRFDPGQSLRIIEEERITLLGQLPLMYMMQMSRPKFARMDWSSVRAFVWGAAPSPPPMYDALAAIASQTGARLVTGYGLTEACGLITYSDPDDDRDMMIRSVGRVVGNCDIRIVDKDRKPVPPGVTGEVAIRGPVMMKGYLNNPAATAEVFDDEGWYYSNDLGWMDETGRLYLSGRRSEMYKTGGENVFPREVEEALEAHPAVLFAAVIGVPDELYNEVGKAFIMLKPGASVTAKELRAFCKERLANFKVPKHFDLREQLPLLPTGKVDKVALRREMESKTEPERS